jgi:ADP-ribose pyrophosphatase YjhB (NUDIX family)
MLTNRELGDIEDLRKVIGTRPLILVGAVVGVLNENGRILLQKRPEGAWGLPGELLELGESAKDAGRREVFEETGVEIGELQLINVFSSKKYYRKLSNGDEFYPVTIAYISKDIKSSTIKIDGKESTDARFFHIKKLPDNTSPLIRKLIQQYTNMFMRPSIHARGITLLFY